MLDYKLFFRLTKEAKDSIKCNSSGHEQVGFENKIVFFLCWWMVPFFTSFISFKLNIKLSNLDDYIGTSIALFIGLFFSLLLSLGDKLKNEKNNPSIDLENYKKIKNNVRQISKITQYAIFIGILISFCLLIFLILNIDEKHNSCIEKILSVIVVFLMSRFLISIFFLSQRFYFLLKDEINNTL